jgi:hypothetical protein
VTLGWALKTRTKIVSLEMLYGIFAWVWIGATVVAIYFLYGALANDASWSNVLWSVAASFVSKQISAVLNANKQRLDYVDQLTERGYEQADAEAAWRTTSDGGANLLCNLQQVELGDEIDRLESAIATDTAEI